MHPNWPVRWPAEWRDAAALDLLKGTPLGSLLLPTPTTGYESIIERARQLDLAICDAEHPPEGVEIVKGEWPGIRMSPGQSDASSGPTGAPWIDSNGWLVRITRTRHANKAVWVTADAPKSTEIVPLPRHLVAVADAAAHGGQWVVTLDKGLADGLAARQNRALFGWGRIMATISFFEAHSEWNGWPVNAVLSVVSSFSGDNEFFSHELLNLMARTNISYGMMETAAFRPEALRSLRATLYPDAGPPSPEVLQALLSFVEQGGLLIAGPKAGPLPGKASEENIHPRYEMRRFGKGRIAVAHQQPDDPYEMAQDAQILLSHRYDLVRFFNGFLLGGYSTISPDGKRRLTHIVNYGGGADGDPATARIAGRYRSAKLWTAGNAQARPLEMAPQNDGIEVHLPGLAVYGGVELETS